MKTFKKLFASLLVIVMIACTMSFTASAADDGTIIIKESSDNSVSVSGKTFNIFRIFDATVDGTNVSYQWYISDGETQSPYYDFFFGTWTDENGGTHTPLIDPTGVTSGNSLNKAVSYIRNLHDNAAGMRECAEELHLYVHAKGITATKNSQNDAIISTSRVEFNNLPYGYYLVVDTTVDLGTNGVRSATMLVSATPDAEINLKATKPTINKAIIGLNAVADGETYADNPYFNPDGTSKTSDGYFADAKGVSVTIDDVVTYKVDMKAPDLKDYHNGYTFVLTDSLPDEQELIDSSIYVYVQGKEISGSHDVDTGSKPASYNYWIVNEDEIEFNLEAKDGENNSVFPAGSTITVVYQTKITADTATSSTNKAVLTYTNDPIDKDATSTVDSTSTVYTYQLVLGKYAGQTDGTATGIRLTGAEFEVYDENGDKMTFIKSTDEYGFDVYIVANEDTIYNDVAVSASDLVTTLKVLEEDNAGATADLTIGGHAGQVKIFGLGAGYYELKETKSPDGYELPVNNFGFTISDSFGTIDGTQTSLTFTASSVENGGASFQNAASIPSTQSISTRLTNIPGSVLPSTGGMGTTIFYIIGIVLMAGALAFFTLRKRSSANNA